MNSVATGVLSFSDHDRTVVGMRYVYPVVSRRAGGVSIGINLNPNNACNWQCMYCQVPGLIRGRAPSLDLALLRHELTSFMDQALAGDFMQTRVPEELRRICDIAFSGNGEPTSSHSFADAVKLVGEIRDDYGLTSYTPIRLITNGSLMGRTSVQSGVSALGALGGEVWFKVDAGRREDFLDINGVVLDPSQVVNNLRTSSELCPTWVQTCLFSRDGSVPGENMIAAYLSLLEEAGIDRLKGVLLYGVARPSMQPAASRIVALDPDRLELYAEIIRKKGLTVEVSP